MRSARERVEFLDSMAASRNAITSGKSATVAALKHGLKKGGVISACAVTSLIAVKTFISRLLRRKPPVAPAPGSIRLAFSKQVITLLLLPLAKEYMLRRAVRAVLPQPSPAPAPVAEPVRVSSAPRTFLSRLNPRRFFSNLMGQ